MFERVLKLSPILEVSSGPSLSLSDPVQDHLRLDSAVSSLPDLEGIVPADVPAGVPDLWKVFFQISSVLVREYVEVRVVQRDLEIVAAFWEVGRH
jgi:hypothetical protein